jgi:hypothetical protein
MKDCKILFLKISVGEVQGASELTVVLAYVYVREVHVRSCGS